MTTYVLVGVLLLGVPAVLIARVLITFLWSLFERVRMHGPAPISSPNSAGRWLGWTVGMLWSLFESKREETYEYSSLTRVQRWNDDLRERPRMGLPQIAQDIPPVTAQPGHALMSRDHQQLTEDGRWWWTGRTWVSVDRFVPPSAPRSVDGSHWWDGAEWRWVPGEFGPIDSYLPTKAVTSGPERVGESWLLRRRTLRNDRWMDKLNREPEPRSDPPPRGLPPVSDPRRSGSERRRSRWMRRGSG